ncbi:MAG TPA: vWA domain-containing protein, partial [Anaerolineales bacterium]
MLSLAVLPLQSFQAGPSTIHIHETLEPQQSTSTSGNLGLLLQTTFSLLDGEGQVLRADIESGTFELQGDAYPATVEALETPWSLVLLIDASKTLGTGTASATWKSVRSTIGSALGGFPENSNIAILKFDDTAPIVLEFTQAKDRLSAAVQTLTPKPSGGSCLNEGVYQAVNKLGGAPGRRAV